MTSLLTFGSTPLDPPWIMLSSCLSAYPGTAELLSRQPVPSWYCCGVIHSFLPRAGLCNFLAKLHNVPAAHSSCLSLWKGALSLRVSQPSKLLGFILPLQRVQNKGIILPTETVTQQHRVFCHPLRWLGISYVLLSSFWTYFFLPGLQLYCSCITINLSLIFSTYSSCSAKQDTHNRRTESFSVKIKICLTGEYDLPQQKEPGLKALTAASHTSSGVEYPQIILHHFVMTVTLFYWGKCRCQNTSAFEVSQGLRDSTQ